MLNLKEALEELASQIKNQIINDVWEEGVNPKTGTNTLISSDMIKNMKVEAVNDNEIVFTIASYYEFVVLGWRRTHNFEGTFSMFIQNILRWIRKKNIDTSWASTENAAAWGIALSIMNRGIMARPFIQYDNGGDPSKILSFLDDYFEKWADRIFEELMQEIDKYFEK